MVTDERLQEVGSRFERYRVVQTEVKTRVALKRPLDFTDIDVTRVVLDHLRLNKTSFRGAKGYLPSLRYAQLRHANFDGAVLEGAFFSFANLEKAQFKGAVLKDCIFWKANLRGANFTGATLVGCDFEDAVLTDTRGL